MIEQFFPNGIGHYLVGGLIIGAAVGLLFVTTGLIGGMSTVFSSTWSYVSKPPFFHQACFTDSRAWRLAYAAGLILGGLAWLIWSAADTWQTGVSWWQLAVGGFLGGFGARMSNG
ncbi:MAG: YeeE/YedE family protein, partial [Methylobacter sp.]